MRIKTMVLVQQISQNPLRDLSSSSEYRRPRCESRVSEGCDIGESCVINHVQFLCPYYGVKVIGSISFLSKFTIWLLAAMKFMEILPSSRYIILRNNKP